MCVLLGRNGAAYVHCDAAIASLMAACVAEWPAMAESSMRYHQICT